MNFVDGPHLHHRRPRRKLRLAVDHNRISLFEEDRADKNPGDGANEKGQDFTPVEKVAELARLNLKPDEKQKIEKDLGAILAYVQKLNALDTKDVEPTSHVLNMENVFRKDEAKPSTAAEKALEHAPQADGRFFKVPKIVQRD